MRIITVELLRLRVSESTSDAPRDIVTTTGEEITAVRQALGPGLAKCKVISLLAERKRRAK